MVPMNFNPILACEAEKSWPLIIRALLQNAVNWHGITHNFDDYSLLHVVPLKCAPFCVLSIYI